MTLTATPIAVPLRADDQGVLRVGNTRITPDILVHAFRDGESPEEIVANYDTLDLADVYAFLTYYLLHTDEVDAYVVQEDEKAAAARTRMKQLFPSDGLRARLMARRQS
jgi:uncharacterized protein (DUF433 family)